MDRRKSLKLIAAGAVAVPTVIAGCKTAGEKPKVEEPTFSLDRNPDELKYEKELLAKEKFFTEHEMATITVLADIIIPKDEVSGSASEAGVPDFIEFIVKDKPEYQIPIRGGIKWLDVQSMKRFDADFVSCSSQQQIEIVDDIAYPEQAKPELRQGVAFFNTMRDLTACGFFTSKIGIKDLGYVGNRPNQWDGVPQDVLDQYGLKYDDRTLEISVKFDNA